jgi:hypothetical protein
MTAESRKERGKQIKESLTTAESRKERGKQSKES